MSNEETKPLKVIDYIDRFEVLELLKRYADLFAEPPVDRKELELVLEIKFKIERLKSADAKEVKQGYWKQGVPYICSVCGKPAPDEKNTSEKYSCWTSPYCPNCGAKMVISKTEITTSGGKANGREL